MAACADNLKGVYSLNLPECPLLIARKEGDQHYPQDLSVLAHDAKKRTKLWLVPSFPQPLPEFFCLAEVLLMKETIAL